MRTTPFRTASLAVLAAAVALAPAPATAKPVPVDGDRWAKAGLSALSHGCVDRRAEPVEQPDVLLRRGPGDAPIGDHSAGWQTHGGGYGAGWDARVARPAGLQVFRIRVNAPGGAALGRAVVRHHPEGDTGYWFGNADLGADSTKGWHTVNAAKRTFTWTHYTADDVADRTGPNATIREFVRVFAGGNGDGARLGFLYGCDENPFYADALELKTGNQHRVFDLGGFRTRTVAWLGETRPKKAFLLHGYELRIGGTLHEKAGGDRRAGTLLFEGRPVSGKKWRRVGKDRAGTDTRAFTTVKPSRSMLYRVRFPGTDRLEGSGSASDVLKVVIRARVAARLTDRTVTRGQRFTVVGSIAPRQKMTVLLQRFRGGSWRTLTRDRSTGDGDFRVGAVARDAGRSYYRVKVVSGGGTRGNVSRNLELTVKAPSGGNPPPSEDDPEPPPPPPPPPPPEG